MPSVMTVMVDCGFVRSLILKLMVDIQGRGRRTLGIHRKRSLNMRHCRVFFLLLGLLLVASPVAANEPDPDDVPTSVQLLRDGIFAYEAHEFSVAVHARLQGWTGWVGDDALLTNGDRMQESGFRLRRARFKLDGTFFKDFEYELELDVYDQERAGGPLYAAWMGYEPCHWFGLRFGVDKFLLMKSDIMSSARMPHLDRPLGTLAMSAGNTMGLVLYTSPWEDHLTVSLGLFNGLRRKQNFFEGYEGVGISLGNQYEGLSMAARFDLEPLSPVGAGMADPAKTLDFRFGLGAGVFANGGLWFGDYDSRVGFFDGFLGGGSVGSEGFSGYVHLKFAGAHVFFEHASEWTDPRTKPTSSATAAFGRLAHVDVLSAGYVLFRNLLGVALRVEFIDDNAHWLSDDSDADIDKEDEGDLMLITATLNYYIVGEFLKAQVEYTHRDERHGTDGDNDYVIGGLQLFF